MEQRPDGPEEPGNKEDGQHRDHQFNRGDQLFGKNLEQEHGDDADAPDDPASLAAEPLDQRPDDYASAHGQGEDEQPPVPVQGKCLNQQSLFRDQCAIHHCAFGNGHDVSHCPAVHPGQPGPQGDTEEPLRQGQQAAQHQGESGLEGAQPQGQGQGPLPGLAEAEGLVKADPHMGDARHQGGEAAHNGKQNTGHSDAGVRPAKVHDAPDDNLNHQEQAPLHPQVEGQIVQIQLD